MLILSTEIKSKIRNTFKLMLKKNGIGTYEGDGKKRGVRGANKNGCEKPSYITTKHFEYTIFRLFFGQLTYLKQIKIK